MYWIIGDFSHPSQCHLLYFQKFAYAYDFSSFATFQSYFYFLWNYLKIMIKKSNYLLVLEFWVLSCFMCCMAGQILLRFQKIYRYDFAFITQNHQTDNLAHRTAYPSQKFLGTNTLLNLGSYMAIGLGTFSNCYYLRKIWFNLLHFF